MNPAVRRIVQELTGAQFSRGTQSRKRLMRRISDSTPNVLHQILICSSRDNAALEVNTLHVSKSRSNCFVLFFFPFWKPTHWRHQDVPRVFMLQQSAKQSNHFFSLGLHIPASVLFFPCVWLIRCVRAMGITQYV